MEQERTLSYALAQKLDEADLEKVAGGSSAGTAIGTHQYRVTDVHLDF